LGNEERRYIMNVLNVMIKPVWLVVLVCLLIVASGRAEQKTNPATAATPKAAIAKVASVPVKEISVDLGRGVKMEMILIPAGEFMMGSEKGGKNEKPIHKVRITKPFYIGKYEVTQEQWLAVMGTNPNDFTIGAKYPVEKVSWYDCQDFAKKVGEKVGGGAFRLPTEAEWEYACRAGTTTEYSFGDSDRALGAYAWYGGSYGNAGIEAHPVGGKMPNAWGLYDMHGNAFEWCEDWYGDSYYFESPADDPQGPSVGDARVIRGGSWNDDFTDHFRCAFRSARAPSNREYEPYGCRLVRTF
jgi:formylglycine-generating enzyme required for sulfatase activity